MDIALRFIACCFFFLLVLFQFSTAQSTIPDSLRRLIDAHPKKDDRRAELLNQLSYELQFSDPEQGISIAQEAIDFGPNLKNKQFLYQAHLEKANNFLQLARYHEALESARKAREGFQTTDLKANLAFAYSTIGIIYNHLSNYPDALANLQQAAKLLREEQHPQEATAYLNMARIFGERKQYDKAAEYLHKATEKAIEMGDKLLQTYCVFNMATLRLETNRPLEGRALLDSALVLAELVDDRMMIGRIYGSMGASYNELKQFDSAEHYLRLAIDYNAEVGNARSRALALMQLSQVYAQTGNPSQAHRYALAAHTNGKQLGIIDLQQSASEALSKHYEKNNRLDSALFYYKQQAILRDSIENDENKSDLTRLELQYDFDLKEQEYLQEQAISKLQFRQLWLAGLVIVVGVLATAGILFYRNRLRTTRLKNEMREKELTQQAESLILQQQLSESELKAIRLQMNPHFIFNVLNSIESYIMENDARSASKLVQRFSKLSRLILENSTQSMVTLDREWATVILYLELEEERFSHSFDYRLEVSSSLNLTEVRVPPMLIQPLVENAIHHGIRFIEGYRGVIAIHVAKQEEQLVVTISDNGIGLSAAKQRHVAPIYKEKSLGIESITERLSLLALSYPDVPPPELNINEGKGINNSGTYVQLVLPYLRSNQLNAGAHRFVDSRGIKTPGKTISRA